LRPERLEGNRRILLGLIGVGRDQIKLGAVAGREADRLALLGRQPGGQRLRVLAVERDLLAQLHRCVVMGGTDEDETQHQAKWVAGRGSRTTITSAKPASAR